MSVGSVRVDEAPERAESTWRTLRRGLALSPELRVGLAGTLGLALVYMVGRVAVPVAVQQGIDRGIAGGLNLDALFVVVSVTAAVLVVTTTCGYLMMRRLFTVSETALAGCGYAPSGTCTTCRCCTSSRSGGVRSSPG
ncbi:hypothetical protein GCM10029963_68180 [Micromonospora andamanensis]